MIVLEVKRCLLPVCEQGKHRFEWERPTLREFMAIQETLGIDPEQWEEQLERMAATIDMKIMQVVLMMLTLMHRRAGIACSYEEMDADITELRFISDPEADAGQEPEEKPTEPTPASPPPEEPAAGSTSGRSRKAASAPRSSPTEAASGGTTASP